MKYTRSILVWINP